MRGPEISLAWLTPGEEVALTMIEARGADAEPDPLGEEHGAQPEAVDDCRVRHRTAALAAVLVRLISCR
jgi:hypothetical protein